MKRTKVLVVGSYPPPVGGITTHVFRLQERVCQDERVDMNVLDLKKMKLFGENGVALGFWDSFVFLFFCNLVHVHISNNAKVAIVALFRALGKKVIYTHHNSVTGNEFVFYLVRLLSNGVVFVNSSFASKMNVAESEVVIPAFLPPFKTPGLREDVRLFLNNYNYVVAINAYSLNYISGGEVYGIDLLVDAVSRINNSRCFERKVCVVFFDPSGAYAKYDFKGVDALTNPAFKRFEGDDLSYFDLLKSCDLSLRPTRTDGDALSIRESLFLGVPVVASDCVERPVGVTLFESGNAVSLAESIEGYIKFQDTVPRYDQSVDFYEELISYYQSVIN